MKRAVGIGGSIHDFAACIIDENGQIIAMEDERINRIRYSLGATDPCEPSLKNCLVRAGMTLSDVDEIVGNDMLDPFINHQQFPHLNLVNHHQTHAYSTFFTSEFEEA